MKALTNPLHELEAFISAKEALKLSPEDMKALRQLEKKDEKSKLDDD